MKDASTPTGTCAVLVTGSERSLCANLAAANKKALTCSWLTPFYVVTVFSGVDKRYSSQGKGTPKR